MAASIRANERLRRREDFLAVMRRGRRLRHRLVGLVVRGNGLTHNRYGFAVGRRVGNAVVRNATKRRLREAVRQVPLETGHDIVVLADRSTASATFQELCDALQSCARRGDLLAPE